MTGCEGMDRPIMIGMGVRRQLRLQFKPRDSDAGVTSHVSDIGALEGKGGGSVRRRLPDGFFCRLWQGICIPAKARHNGL